jgi:hypothetical protein
MMVNHSQAARKKTSRSTASKTRTPTLNESLQRASDKAIATQRCAGKDNTTEKEIGWQGDHASRSLVTRCIT